MSKEKLTYVRREEKTSKAGKPYTSFSIKVESRGDKFISGFGNKGNASWKEGDEVEIEIEQKGNYLNWSTPKVPAGYQLANNEIQKELNIIKDMLGRIISIVQPVGKKDNYPVMDETNNGEPPF